MCRTIVRMLYFRVEVLGADNLPASGAVILCVNHVNSLVDGVIVQALTPRVVRPVARKRLFDMPLTGHILNAIRAVPVYSRAYGDRGENEGGFDRLYQLIDEGELIIIFPEGHSHETPRLYPIKTGAARMVLGAQERGSTVPKVIPVGLTYSEQAKFRRSVLVQIGEAVDTDDLPEGQEAKVLALTNRIQARMEKLVLNAGSWEELSFAMRLVGFFELRQTKSSLHQRFATLQVLLDHQYRLRSEYPSDMASLEAKLNEFAYIRKRHQIEDYQLGVEYTLPVVSKYIVTSLGFVFIAVPLALWGFINNLLPYIGLKIGMRTVAISKDQIDTARVLGSMVLMTVFWSLQSYLVYRYHGANVAFFYLLSLPLATAAVLVMRERRKRILSNLRVFFLFLRKRKLKGYLLQMRSEIEHDLSELVRLAKLQDDAT